MVKQSCDAWYFRKLDVVLVLSSHVSNMQNCLWMSDTIKLLVRMSQYCLRSHSEFKIDVSPFCSHGLVLKTLNEPFVPIYPPYLSLHESFLASWRAPSLASWYPSCLNLGSTLAQPPLGPHDLPPWHASKVVLPGSGIAPVASVSLGAKTAAPRSASSGSEEVSSDCSRSNWAKQMVGIGQGMPWCQGLIWVDAMGLVVDKWLNSGW